MFYILFIVIVDTWNVNEISNIKYPCGELCKIVKLLPLTSQYIFSLALFVVNKKKSLFVESSQLHNITTGNNASLFQPSSHLTVYQKVPHYFGIKLHNKLPFQTKTIT